LRDEELQMLRKQNMELETRSNLFQKQVTKQSIHSISVEPHTICFLHFFFQYEDARSLLEDSELQIRRYQELGNGSAESLNIEVITILSGQTASLSLTCEYSGY